MPETENELEARSFRFILSAILRQLGELSDYLPYDQKSLPAILNKVEQIAKDLDEAQQKVDEEFEKRMKDLSSILGNASEGSTQEHDHEQSAAENKETVLEE